MITWVDLCAIVGSSFKSTPKDKKAAARHFRIAGEVQAVSLSHTNSTRSYRAALLSKCRRDAGRRSETFRGCLQRCADAALWEPSMDFCRHRRVAFSQKSSEVGGCVHEMCEAREMMHRSRSNRRATGFPKTPAWPCNALCGSGTEPVATVLLQLPKSMQGLCLHRLRALHSLPSQAAERSDTMQETRSCSGTTGRA